MDKFYTNNGIIYYYRDSCYREGLAAEELKSIINFLNTVSCPSMDAAAAKIRVTNHDFRFNPTDNYRSALIKFSYFNNIIFDGVYFTKLFFSQCDFENCEFIHCGFYNVNLNRTVLSHCTFNDCDFTSCQSDETTQITGCDFSTNNRFTFGESNHAGDAIIVKHLDGNNIPPKGVPMLSSIGKAILGFKALQNNKIAVLIVPEDASRSNAFSVACRAETIYVLGIYDLENTKWVTAGTNFLYSEKKIYVEKQTYTISNFNQNRWIENTTGFHYYMTIDGAMNMICDAGTYKWSKNIYNFTLALIERFGEQIGMMGHV